MAQGDTTSEAIPVDDLSLVQGDPGFHLQRRLRLIPAAVPMLYVAALQLPLSAVLGKVVKALV